MIGQICEEMPSLYSVKKFKLPGLPSPTKVNKKMTVIMIVNTFEVIQVIVGC